MMRVMVTGADGFLGRHLCERLVNEGCQVSASVWDRQQSCAFGRGVDVFESGEIDSCTDWTASLRGVDVVVHLAARVHVMSEMSSDPLAEYRKVNVEGTRRLAEAADRAKVRRLVFMSTVGVHGKETGSKPFTEDDVYRPHNDYSLSKVEAENALNKISREVGLEIVMVRAPLVYGPGVRGNFLRLLKLVDSSIPLPFASMGNGRSMVGIGNLVDLIVCCLGSSRAANEAFLVADGEDIKTRDLVQKIVAFMRKRTVLFPFPIKALRMFAKAVNKAEAVDGLWNSLRVDAGKARELLSWQPRTSLDEGLEATVNQYLIEKEGLKLI